ncbi:MAG: hypothetical protein AAF085_08635, partial [Planctomycetota bacterium]
FIVSLTQRQADATFKKCKQHVKAFRKALGMVGQVHEREWVCDTSDQAIDGFTFKAREIELPNGAKIVSLPGRDPDNIAGLTGNVIFTEFGLFPNGGYDHWRVVFPLTTRGYKCIVISTPRGKDTKFYELCSDPDTYSYHFCDIHASIACGAYTPRNNQGQPCSLDEFKRLYGDDIGFKREYECEFTGDLDALVRWAKLEAAAMLAQGSDFDFKQVIDGAGWESGFFGRDLPKGGRFEIGWDVARASGGDLSALWVNHTMPGHPRHLRYLVTMRGCEFALMRSIVREVMDCRVATRASVGAGDSTGLGMESNEVLENLYPGRWEGINFAGKRKGELCSGIATAFIDGDQTLPGISGPYKFIATDVYAIQKQPTTNTSDKSLKVTFTQNPLVAESHCDIAMAGGLAIASGTQAGQTGGMVTS